MTDKPILFSAPMIRALLDGRKTQTRRVLKPQPGDLGRGFLDCKLPYAIGYRLWVREAFVTGFDIDDEFGRPVGDRKVWYRATDSGLTWYDPDTESTLDNPPWRPSIHMPRWASRLTLTVTDVRVQRVQEISEADAREEGCAMNWIGEQRRYGTWRDGFSKLWDTLNAPRGFGWEVNPWCCAISFRVDRANIDAPVA